MVDKIKHLTQQHKVFAETEAFHKPDGHFKRGIVLKLCVFFRPNKHLESSGLY